MSRQFIYSLALFIAINVVLYTTIFSLHGKIPFNTYIYKNSSHHFFRDERAYGGAFNFLRALGQFDAQWYLKIASTGYPPNPTVTSMINKKVMDGLTYAFFPLYPLVLSMVNIFVGNIELTAFITANLIIIALFVSLYYIINKLYTHNVALKTIFLIFVFPFGIFFRSYFTEGLFLFLLVWFVYFLVKKQLFLLSLSSSLLYVTRPTGLFLLPLIAVLMAIEIRRNKLSPVIACIYFTLSLLPFGLWLLFNYKFTGNPAYWMNVQQSWFTTPSTFNTIRYNLTIIANFFRLPTHDFHRSRVDIAIIIYAAFLLYASRKHLKKELWWISFLFWLLPLLTHDTISYSRYQSVNFPLFIFLAQKLQGKAFIAVSAILFAILLITSLYFVNWYWIG